MSTTPSRRDRAATPKWRPRPPTRLVNAVVVALALWQAASTPAEARRRNKDSLAKKHFVQGELHYRQAEFRKALAAYKQAQSYKRHPALLFNIAQCHRQLGEPQKALFFYKLFLSEMPRAPNREEVEGFIRQMRQAIQHRKQRARDAGRLTVVSQPKGAQVWLDTISEGAAPAGRTPLVTKVAPGQHLVVIRQPGYRTVHRTVNVAQGGVGLVTVELVPLSGRPAPKGARRPPPKETRRRPPEARRPGAGAERPRPARPAPRPRRRIAASTVEAGEPVARRTAPFYKRWWFWTGLGTAALLGATGGALGVMALDSRDQWEKTWDESYKRRGEAQRMGADIAIVSAVGLALASIIGAAVVGYGKTEDPHPTPNAIFAPSCGPGRVGVTVQGRW